MPWTGAASVDAPPDPGLRCRRFRRLLRSRRLVPDHFTALALVAALGTAAAYLESHALGVFRLGYGRLGPTEARLALIALTVALALGVALPLDAIVLGASAAMAGGLAIRAAGVLRELARREPAPTRP